METARGRTVATARPDSSGRHRSPWPCDPHRISRRRREFRRLSTSEPIPQGLPVELGALFAVDTGPERSATGCAYCGSSHRGSDFLSDERLRSSPTSQSALSHDGDTEADTSRRGRRSFHWLERSPAAATIAPRIVPRSRTLGRGGSGDVQPLRPTPCLGSPHQPHTRSFLVFRGE